MEDLKQMLGRLSLLEEEARDRERKIDALVRLKMEKLEAAQREIVQIGGQIKTLCTLKANLHQTQAGAKRVETGLVAQGEVLVEVLNASVNEVDRIIEETDAPALLKTQKTP